MQQSRDEGRPVISGKVRLVQEDGKAEQAGVLMLHLPVFGAIWPGAGKAWPVGSARRSHERSMDGIFGVQRYDANAMVNLEVHDGATLGRALYRDSPHDDSHQPPAFSVVKTIEVAGHDWTLRLHSSPAFDSRRSSENATRVLVTGSLLSLLMFAVVWLLVNGRWRARDYAVQLIGQIRESETRFRNLADASPALIWTYDVDEERFWFNHPWHVFTGSSPGDDSNTLLFGHAHPDDVELRRKKTAQALNEHIPFQYEYRLRRHDQAAGCSPWACRGLMIKTSS
jgi:PAS domain-containing protein